MADRSFERPPSGKAAPLLEAGKISGPDPQGSHSNRARSGWFSRIRSPQESRTAKTPDADSADQQPAVTYWVTTSNEKRRTPRRRTRLRAGKIVDSNNQFLSECVIVDRSARGIRVRPMRKVALPQFFRLYDDLDKKIVDVCRVWSDNGDIGVVLRDVWESAQTAKHPCATLGGKYYAVND
ncbi:MULTISPECIES: hypothetical protein [unclassified Beijerinckia]|uniref:hypothetical protein n=1 Tax=unclassified Beijerinckia TaxID=2638183 RepID=UPI000895CD6A|nr:MULTISPECIES: hypothetical protein [unclassified Beijerinckia]MDH7798673.1 hypothetical protein [Beijerinckia sp. GAS462]SED28869.1 hypothetical protein SAMN05443249_4973 [Beijerinckia sp. 28-YEA-48]